MSNNRALLIASLGAAAAGVAVYAFSGRRRGNALRTVDLADPLPRAAESKPLERGIEPLERGIEPPREGAMEPPRAQSSEPPESGVERRAEMVDPLLLDAAADLYADELLTDELSEPDNEPALTVQPDLKVPPLASADDAEPPSPDDLGSFWLSGATQSERSLTELDLEPDLEALADLREPDEGRESEDEPESDDDEDEAREDASSATERL